MPNAQTMASRQHGLVLTTLVVILLLGILAAHPLPPITMKGISRDVVPYVVEAMLNEAGTRMEVFSEHSSGLDFYLDPTRLDAPTAEHVRSVLRNALDTLERLKPGVAPTRT